MLNKVLAKVKALWAREPVLVSTVLPVLVTLGWLSQSQANTVVKVAAGVASVVAELAAAWTTRSKVTSPATAAALRGRLEAALHATAPAAPSDPPKPDAAK